MFCMSSEPVTLVHKPSTALPTGKNHVSASEMRTWAECSWRHQLGHVKGIDLSEPSPVPTFGTACHEGCESFLQTRCMDVQVTHRAIDRLWDMCGFKDEVGLARFLERRQTTLEAAIEEYGFGAKSRAEAHRDADLVLTEVPAFMEETFPGWKHVAAELALYEPIGGTGVSLKGFVDCVIEAHDKRGRPLTWIIDWKTSAWGWKTEKKQDPLVQAQLVLYKRYWMQKMAAEGLALLDEHGPDDPRVQSHRSANMRLRDVRCGFVLLKRSAKPGEHCELVPVSVGDAPIQRVEKRTLDMISSLRRGVAVKNRSACTYCDFNGTCLGTWVDHKGRIHRV